MLASEQTAPTFDVKLLNLKKLRDLDVRKQFQIKISKSFTALENLNDSEDRKRT